MVGERVDDADDRPHLTFFVRSEAEPNSPQVYPTPDDTEPIASIICKQAPHRERKNRGYIGMLSVTMAWRRRGIARKLVEHAMRAMEADGVDEVCRTNLFLSSHQIMLETEYDNAPSLALYSALGFVREKRLHRFYSNGKDA
jgi:peptide alpha-N-acetyltransferase